MKSLRQFIKEDKLENDIQSLKRIGWKLDKVTKFLITKGSDYGIKMTSDLIAKIYNPPQKLKRVKAPKAKKVKWPNDPPASKRKDSMHAEKYLNQAIASEESPDMTGSEAYSLLTQAGYNDETAFKVVKNMGWEGDLSYAILKKHGVQFAKKSFPKKKARSVSEANMTNGITWKLASVSDRIKGESYVVFLKDTKELVAHNLKRISAKEIEASDPKKYAMASSEFYHDKIKIK